MAQQIPPGFQLVQPYTSSNSDIPEGFEIITTPNATPRLSQEVPPPGRIYNPDVFTGLKKGAQRLPGLVLGIPGDIGRFGVAAQDVVGAGVGKVASVAKGKPVTIPRQQTLIPGPFETLAMLPGSSELIGATESVFGEAPSPTTPQGRAAQLGVEFAPMMLGPRKLTKGTEVISRTIPQKIADVIKGVGSRAGAALIPAATVSGAEYLSQGTALEPYADVAGLVAGGMMASPGRVGSVVSKTKVPTTALQTATDNAFASLRKAGITYEPKAIDNLIGTLETKFGKGPQGMFGNPDRQKLSFSLIDDLKKLRGGSADWSDIHNIRSEASTIANTFDPKLATERKFARAVIEEIDKFHAQPPSTIFTSTGNLPPERVKDLTQNAFALTQRLGKTRTIEGLMNVADVTQDPAKTLRSNFQRLATRIASGKSKGWTKDEISAINSIAKGNYDSGAMNTLASLGVDTSLMGGMRTLAYGASVGIPQYLDMGVAIPIAAATIGLPATAARMYGPRAIQNRSQQVRNLIAAGPAGQEQARRIATANRLRQTYGLLQAPDLLDEGRR